MAGKQLSPEQFKAKEIAAQCCAVCLNKSRQQDGEPVCRLCWPFFDEKIGRYILARYRRDRTLKFPDPGEIHSPKDLAPVL